jgi:hypothetical protein
MEFPDGRVFSKNGVYDPALHAYSFSMNDPHFGQTLESDLVEIFRHDDRHLSGLKCMQVDGVFNRKFVHAPILFHFLLRVFEQVSRLATQLPAESLERRKPDRARFVCLQDRQVGDRDADPVRKFRQRHSLFQHDPIEVDVDGHDRSDRQGLVFFEPGS